MGVDKPRRNKDYLTLRSNIFILGEWGCVCGRLMLSLSKRRQFRLHFFFFFLTFLPALDYNSLQLAVAMEDSKKLKLPKKEDEDQYSIGTIATIRNYFVLPFLIGVGFSLGMAVGYEVFDVAKSAFKELRHE